METYCGNKETGWFCVGDCLRIAAAEVEVIDFDSTRQALMHGYLPCVDCQPMIGSGAVPEVVSVLLTEVCRDPSTVLKDYDVAGRGIDPDWLRRWFQKAHGLSFQDFLRLQRINDVFGTISHGSDSSRSQTDTATVVVTRVHTPLGPMLAAATSSGICLLEFMDRRMLETQLARLRKYFGSSLDTGISPHFDTLNQQLAEHFAGGRKMFSVPLDVPGTEFQTRAWDALVTIPYGETRSYQQQAEAIGRPRAVRAVAKANGDNRVSIVIPCHRVIGKDGSLTGYGGKLWRKQKLLELESAEFGTRQTNLFHSG